MYQATDTSQAKNKKSPKKKPNWLMYAQVNAIHKQLTEHQGALSNIANAYIAESYLKPTVLRVPQHTSQAKPQKYKHNIVKLQVDALYEQLITTRGALLPIANALLYFKYKHAPKKDYTQRRLAKAAGYQRQTGWSNCHKLADGYFMTMRRVRLKKDKDAACDYQLNPILFCEYARKKLGDLLPLLQRFMTLSILLSNRYIEQTCTPYIEYNNRDHFFGGMPLVLFSLVVKNSLTLLRASPLPGSLAHEPSKNEDFLKGEDYERFALAIGATIYA